MSNPLARKTNVYVEHLLNEVIVYDKTNHQAHSLNSTVFEVWKNADGTKTVDDLAGILSEKFRLPSSGDLVVLALEDLKRANLVEDDSKLASAELPSRREIGRKLAIAGVSASLLPFVASIVAPTPAMARSSATPYTTATYEKELATATVDYAKDGFKNPTVALKDYDAGITDGNAGIKAALQKNISASQADFKNAETEFDDMLNALGLPPL